MTKKLTLVLPILLLSACQDFKTPYKDIDKAESSETKQEVKQNPRVDDAQNVLESVEKNSNENTRWESFQKDVDQADQKKKPVKCQPKNSTEQGKSQKSTTWQAIQLEIDESEKNK